MKKFLNLLLRNKHSKMLLFTLTAFTCISNAQTTLSGLVTDENQQGLPGVSIKVKGTTQASQTDSSGNYKINVAGKNKILVFTHIGYLSSEFSVRDQLINNIKLQPDVANLQQIIVVGYGTQKKADLTGAVAIVDVKELNKTSNTTITDQLQGRIAGVQVIPNGEPGSIGDVKIRGTSFFGNSNPLYVIDGVLTGDSPDLNPSDVESIQVLKDASASSIYGSRAANGVIIIETKKGRRGKPEINFTARTGLQRIARRLDLANSTQWARITNAASDYAGAPRQSLAVDVPDYSTDWQSAVFQTGQLQDYTASISSGGEKNKSYFSINNTYQEGAIIGTQFERWNIRLNNEFQLTRRLKIGENLTLGEIRGIGQESPNQPGFASVIQSAATMLPVIPVYDPTTPSGYGFGQMGKAETFTANPVGEKELFKNFSNSERILGNGFLNYQIIDGLEYNFSFGVNSDLGFNKNYNRATIIRWQSNTPSGLSEDRSENLETLLEHRLMYSKTFGNHHFTVMSTYTEQQDRGHYQSTNIMGGFDGENPIFEIGATTASPNQIISSGGEYTSVIRSYLGRLTYNYADKYLLTANVRRDGSSKFAKDVRWGTFPSISAGWVLSKENFFKVPDISNLKIRAGYGQVGNASIGDYLYQTLISSSSLGGVNYNLGPGSVSVIGATRGGITNHDIKWEVLKELNLGTDVDMFKGQLSFTGDVYFGKMQDLLTEVPVPGTIGVPDGASVTLNAVSMQRRGWEASLIYRKLKGNFNFTITANASHSQNKLTVLPFGVPNFIDNNSLSVLGSPLGQLYLLQYQGIYTSQSQIDALPADFSSFGDKPQLGDAIFKDVNGRDDKGNVTNKPDGQINDDDRIISGNPIPYLEYGLNIELSYKKFDLNVFIEGTSKRDVYNSVYSNFGFASSGSNYPASLNPWINGKGTDPRIFENAVINGHVENSTYYRENGAYLGIQNIQLGYSFSFSKIKSLRVYISGQNIYKFTKYRGYDPQFQGSVFAPGVDPFGFPNVSTYSAGLNLTF